jgi:hypothetical protein
VIDARRQLTGGPPVVTRPRDVDAEIAAWRERRATRTAQAEQQSQQQAQERPRRRGLFRRM